MTTLDATIHERPRLRIPTMAEIQKALENVDARRLIVTASTFVAILGLLLGGTVTATVWVVRTTDKAAAIAPIQQQLGGLNSKLDTMQGSVNALMTMQATVAETKAEVGALNSRLDSMDTAIQSQNAWIMTTRERLSRQGFETPEFQPKGQ
jgi:peptidoglycan hydrolase CwlO-like protein